LPRRQRLGLLDQSAYQRLGYEKGYGLVARLDAIGQFAGVSRQSVQQLGSLGNQHLARLVIAVATATRPATSTP
jgi:hypothetical protein